MGTLGPVYFDSEDESIGVWLQGACLRSLSLVMPPGKPPLVLRYALQYRTRLHGNVGKGDIEKG